MALPVTITCAPCCWGVDDVSNPHLPPWERVLDEAAEAGFGGLELGPYGYMPLDAGRVATALGQRRLSIVAGTIFDDLVSPAKRQNLLRQTEEICALVTSVPRPKSHPGQRFPAPYLTVMDWGHDERDYAAGHPDRAPRLDREAWDGMIANFRAIAELARDRYVRWLESASLGDHHMHGPEASRFYTWLKTITTRLPTGARSEAEFVMPTMG
jgi:inosose dehydratase